MGKEGNEIKFSQNWKNAFDERDRHLLEARIDDGFEFVRHQGRGSVFKKEMLDIWSSEGPRPERRDYRILYENEDILVTHQFMTFTNGEKESVMVVMHLKDGKLVRMETGATPMTR